jgi:hypothetical protein
MLVYDFTTYSIYIILLKKWQANTRLTANVFLEIEWTAGVINLSKDIVAPAALWHCHVANKLQIAKREKGKGLQETCPQNSPEHLNLGHPAVHKKALKMTYEGQRPLHACGCHLSSTQQ